MNDGNRQFIILPHFGNLSDKKLKYTDALTYIAARSFDGVEGCFPSYEAIATRASCSRDFVVKSIKRLDKAGFILVKRGKKIKRDHNEVNRYEFSESHMFEQIPVEVFEAELGLHDKAMLITLRQFFRSGKLEYAYSIHYMAKHLGITYKVIKDRIDSLVKLGFIEIITNARRNLRSSKRIPKKHKYDVRHHFTDKINWIWNYGYKTVFILDGEKAIPKIIVS